MKVIIVALALVAVVAAHPVAETEPIKILRSQFDANPEGGYVFDFETENGIKRSEQGEVREALDEENKPHPVVVVRGSYSYVDVNGNPETITYYADETGYHPEGASIPKVPSPSRR
ncbi:larval cuticle protein 1-like [Vanessa atalanta]|uniref:larval cuticle protein 1-like n=1 Tax=Vanessa atalanta TaxID=42275 RepID=UPI001FCCD164|nr:larval cuticle protein 1-like [Vanessa atalanta]